jgi:ubiquinone/menaquinone biosynthesis C-methylase UbiE
MAQTIRDYFEQRAAGWDAMMPPDFVERLRAFAAPLAEHIRTDGALLEIGTGTGAFLPALREIAPRARIVSLDLARAMLQQARQRFPDAALAQADAHALPLRAQAFDRVICHNSFPHFADQPRALHEIRRVLRSGGRLLILHNDGRDFINALHAQLGAPIHHDVLPDTTTMRAMLIQAGYRDIDIDDAPNHYIAQGRA